MKESGENNVKILIIQLFLYFFIYCIKYHILTKIRFFETNCKISSSIKHLIDSNYEEWSKNDNSSSIWEEGSGDRALNQLLASSLHESELIYKNKKRMEKILQENNLVVKNIYYNNK